MKSYKKENKSLEILNENQITLHKKKQLSFAINNSLKYLILIFLSFLFLVPIYWVIATSLKTSSNVLLWPPQLIPNPLTLDSYKEAFNKLPIGRMALNSLIIAGTMILTNVVCCSLAGYVFARKDFYGKDILFGLIISTMMIPMHIRLIPLYLITIKFGMNNTYLGIVFPSAITGFGIFLMRQYFSTFPKAIEDAARVDGCNEWGVLFRIVLPNAKAAIVSLVLYVLVLSIGDFLWPMIVTSTTAMRPLPVGITLFIDKEVYAWGPMMAMNAIVIVPASIIFILLQRNFVHGITAGALKG